RDTASQVSVSPRLETGNKFWYTLTCVGFCVGLRNIWRFQYLTQSAFLIPYVIALVFEGLPLLHMELHMELAIGQWLRMGSVGVWSVQSPHIREVRGFDAGVFLVGLFYNMILSPLPWRDCPVNLNHTDQWVLAVVAGVVSCIVYICFIRGIETIGSPIDGSIYLFTPNWETLKNLKVWLDAATQIFFSLSLAFGGLIAFSSYNPQKNNCERDALIVGCVNSFASIYASVPIFAILVFLFVCLFFADIRNILTLTNAFNIGVGNITLENYGEWLNYLNKTDPLEVKSLNLKACNLQTFLEESASGTGLAFILFTEAVIEMSASQVWAVLFFVMLFCLGLSSMFGNLEGVLTPLLDLHIVPPWIPKEAFTGIPKRLNSLTFYVGSVPLLIIAFFEIIAVAFIFGINRFNDDIEWMTGRPFVLLVVFVAYVVIEAEKQPTYNAWNPDYVHFPLADVLHYPEWVFAICVLLSILPVVSIPLVAFYKFMCFLKNYTMNRQSESICK
uniref:Solute carrier family 6 member 18 n=1 Tax=Neolamprologus brichardi TaxID=32507 RepID=A0A3Q4HP95_NEOBR